MRLVVVDDTDPSIQYSGPWFEVENTQINTGDYGTPFQNTLHGVTVNANFSFPFKGSVVFVYGTSITTDAPGAQDPSWECFIDNTSIGSFPDSGSSLSVSDNNWILCGAGPGQFQDGPHLLTVKANVSNQQTFWFDQIQYAPSASVSLNQSILRIDSSDSAIQYSSGWRLEGIPINSHAPFIVNSSITQTSGDTLTYHFSGTSISGFGTAQFGTQASSTYAIDDQIPSSFPFLDSKGTFFNQVLFETAQLSPGQHKLVVTYLGNSSALPLFFGYFVQHPSSTPSKITPTSSNTPTSTSVPSGSSSNSSPSSSNIDSKPIIGGVIGGVVLISLLLVLFFFIRRRNNRRAQTLSEKPYIDPFLEVMHPFTVPSSSPTSTFLPQNYTSNGQSLPSQSDSDKFTQRDQPSDPASTSITSGGIPPSTALQPQFSSPVFISPSSSPLPLTGSQTNIDSTRTRVPQATTEPSMQQSLSPQGANVAFLLRHEDSGVRIPAEDVVELPPLYTPG